MWCRQAEQLHIFLLLCQKHCTPHLQYKHLQIHRKVALFLKQHAWNSVTAKTVTTVHCNTGKTYHQRNKLPLKPRPDKLGHSTYEILSCCCSLILTISKYKTSLQKPSSTIIAFLTLLLGMVGCRFGSLDSGSVYVESWFEVPTRKDPMHHKGY